MRFSRTAAHRVRVAIALGVAAAVVTLAPTGTLGTLSAEPGRRVEESLERGRIRIAVYADRGDFMLWYRDAEEQWAPLLFPGEPAAVVTTVLDAGRTTIAGRSNRLRLDSVERRGDIIVQRFEGLELQLERIFTPLRSRGARESDSVLIEHRLHNKSQRGRELGLRVLLDTKFGETAPRNEGHFRLDGTDRVRHERDLFPKSESVRFWFSRDADNPEIALQQTLIGNGITTPDRVVFANWRRLHQSDWEYTVLPGRRFSDPPYSLNDSAVAAYYRPQPLAPGEIRSIALVLGAYAPAGFHELDTDAPREADRVAAPDPEPEPAAVLRMDPERRAEYLKRLRELDELVRDLDRKAARPGDLTAERLQELRQRLDELREPQ